MKNMLAGLVATTVYLATISLVNASPTFKTTISGAEADARFVGFTDACHDELLDINVLNDASTDAPAPTSIAIFLSYVDECNNIIIRDAFGFFDFDHTVLIVSKKADRASLSATLTLFDNASQADIPIRIDLQWSATSAPVNEKDVGQDRGADGVFFTKSRSQSADAIVTGSVSDGTMNYMSAGVFAADISNHSSTTIFHERR